MSNSIKEGDKVRLDAGVETITGIVREIGNFVENEVMMQFIIIAGFDNKTYRWFPFQGGKIKKI